jgi:multiple antibiotic resistance protein
MLHGEQSAVHRSLSDDPESDEEAALSVAVTPLAIPILSGPGTLATAMNFSATGHLLEALITIVTFAVLCLITYVFFIYGERVVRYLGRDGLSMVTRIMGFILAVIGVQMLLGGIAGAIAIYHK